jgi:hypothetical protein
VEQSPFADWLPDVVRDPVVVRPDDIIAEARGNQWSFSLTPSQAASVTIPEVLAFAAEVSRGRTEWLRRHSSAPVVLYWWHDSQAGQLRFSLVSASHGRLPFGCPLSPAPELATIVSAWLAAPISGGVRPLPVSAQVLAGASPRQPGAE